MKIALFLNSYPKLSEPFIDLFISHLEGEHQVYLITQIDKKTKKKTSITIHPFLNFKGLGIIEKFKISCKILYYLKRYFALRDKGIQSKQLISDAGLWTIPKLDYIHFPFGNLAFAREHYAEVMGCKMSISFRGSDLNVYPVFHNLNYGLVLEKSDKIHCNSIELKNKLSNHGLLKLEKVTIIHSAIRSDYEINDSSLKSVISLRDYKIEKIITVGRLHWVKDYALSFQALGILKKEGFQFEYNIIGDGPDKEHLMYLADLQRSRFARAYGYGVVGVLFFHFLVNIGMTIGLMPIMGIPLPFFSYGGSSLWSFTILLFIFLKLDSHRSDMLSR